MPDYSTNVIFRLSVAGDEALNALRTYLSGMKQLLGELNSSAEGARTGINAAANASAAMGTSLSEITKQGAGAAQAINSVAEATRNLNAAQTESKAMSAGTAAETRFSFAGDAQGLQRYWEQQEIQKQHMANNAEMAAEERLRGTGYSFAGDERGLQKWFEQKEAQRQHEENRLAQVELDRQQGLRNQSLAAQGKMWVGESNVLETFAGGAEAASLQMWGVRRIAFDLQQIGQQGMNTTMQMIESLSNAIEVYGEFNDATTRAGATMELPIELMGELEEGVRAASIETAKFSPQQVAEGLRMWAAGTGEVISTTGQLNDILKDTTTIQKLAAMNSVALEQTMTNVGGVMAAYGMKTDEVNRVASVFNYVAAQTFANVDDLGEAFVFVGPIAAQMGITFEETAAALALLSDSNIRGSKAGRAFRQMLIALADPTKSVDDAMTALVGTQTKMGDSWKDIVFEGGEFMGLAEYVDLLAASVENLTSAEQGQRLAELATANALPGLTTLVMEQVEARKSGINIISVYTKILENNIDSEVRAYKEMYEAQTGYTFSTEGALARMENQWDRYINSSSGQLDKMKQEWNSAVLAMAKPMAEVFLPILVKVAGAIADVSDFFSGKWVAGVAAGTIAIYGLSSGFLLLAGRLIQAGALIYTLQEGMKAVRAMGGWGAGMASLASGTGRGAAIAQSALVLKAAITSGAVAAGGIIAAAIVASAWAVKEILDRGKEEQRIDAFLSRPTTGASRFGEMFDQEEVQLHQMVVTKYVAKTEEAKRLLQDITGETKGWTHNTEDVLSVMQRISTEMKSQVRLTGGGYVKWVDPHDARDAANERRAVNALSLQQADEDMADAWRQYGEDRNDIISDYQQQESGLVSDHNDWMVDAEKGLVRQLSDLANSYAKSKARDARDFAISRGREVEDFELSQLETIEDAQKEREKATKDHYEELQKLARDHQNNLVDLLEERDVRGITKEMRSYQENVSDAERDYGQTMADSQQETEKALADAVAEFNKRLLREDADRLQDLADQEADYQESVSSTIQDYNESVAEQEAELAKNKDKLKEEMAGDLADLEAELADSLAELNGTMDKLNAEMYPKWISEVKKFWEDYESEWLNGFLAIADMAGLIAALDLGLDVDPKWTAIPNTGTRDQMRASGGYASHGRYVLGEGGQEFVLNAASTRLMEDRFGSLSQNTFRNIGQTFNFSPVISGVGRQDASAVTGVLDEWWKTKQRQIKDMVRA